MIKLSNLFGIWSLLFCYTATFSQPYAQPGKIDYALQAIKYAYVDTIDEKKITDDAIRAMVKDLDPHSVYIPVEEMREMNEPLAGKFEGVGIQFNILQDTIMVTQTIAGGPSEKLGIRQGDRIVKIDGVVKAGVKITNNDVLKLLRGDKGTKVTVGILRRGNAELIDYTITRDQIPLFSVDATYMVTPKVGYIKISRFAENTVEEFKSALAKLKAQGMESLVLDLQGNGGGYLSSAVKLSDEFLPEGKKIVFTRGRTTMSEDYNASSSGGWEKGKLAILIDESSASASEIVSGAVQDWDRGVIIGRRSFGKGLVQKPIPLPDGSAIRLTVAHYYTPSGRCIQKPYELGDEEEYELDFANRIKNGELTNPDSVHFSDSTIYFTSNKRVVRGGGGIMPDLFVPLDTTEFSTFFSDLRRQNAFNDFLLTWVDNNRTELKKNYPTLADFNSKYFVSEKFMNDFLANAEKLKAKSDTAGGKSSKVLALKSDTLKAKSDSIGLKLSYELIRLNIKAVIAQNIWNVEGAVEVYNERNNALKRAVEALNDNTFEKMKIAWK